MTVVQVEQLVVRGLVGDQRAFQQLGTGACQRVVDELGNERGDGLVAVVADAVGVAHGGQEQVEREGWRLEAADMVMADQAMIQPAELAGDATAASRVEEAFAFSCLFDGVSVERLPGGAPRMSDPLTW